VTIAQDNAKDDGAGVAKMLWPILIEAPQVVIPFRQKIIPATAQN